MDIDHIDKQTIKLANEIRDLLGQHMAEIKADYQIIISSCLVALSTEIGRLRWLAVSTNEVEEDNFDRVFWESLMKHFQENKNRYGSPLN